MYVSMNVRLALLSTATCIIKDIVAVAATAAIFNTRVVCAYITKGNCRENCRRLLTTKLLRMISMMRLVCGGMQKPPLPLVCNANGEHGTSCVSSTEKTQKPPLKVVINDIPLKIPHGV